MAPLLSKNYFFFPLHVQHLTQVKAQKNDQNLSTYTETLLKVMLIFTTLYNDLNSDNFHLNSE